MAATSGMSRRAASFVCGGSVAVIGERSDILDGTLEHGPSPVARCTVEGACQPLSQAYGGILRRAAFAADLGKDPMVDGQRMHGLQRVMLQVRR